MSSITSKTYAWIAFALSFAIVSVVIAIAERLP